MRNSVLIPISAAAALLVGGCQEGGPQPPSAPTHLRDAIAPPRAVAFAANPLGPEIMLAVQTQGGLAYSYWNDNALGAGGWSAWQRDDNNSGANAASYRDEYFPLVGWVDDQGRTRANGFFFFYDAAENPRIAAPHWSVQDFGYRWDVHDPLVSAEWGRDFWPITGVAWPYGPTARLNFYGAVSAPVRPPYLNSIREYWWDGSSWGWSDLGRPNDDVIVLAPGPQSVVVTQGGGVQETFLFATGGDGGTPTDTRVWLLYHHNIEAPDWEWEDLGSPDDLHHVRDPLAIQHADPATGQARLSVFVVAADRSGIFRLYERHRAAGDDWDDWGDWQSWGRPPSPNVPGVTLDPRIMGFDMTSAVVWTDQAGTLRINLFGHTDSYANTAGLGYNDGGHLVEFFWDGANWNWGATDPTPARAQNRAGSDSTVPFRTFSSVVVDGPARDRVSVFGLDEEGTIWERYWDTAEGSQWIWQDH